MKILFPAHIGNRPLNPFLIQLIEATNNRRDVEFVGFGMQPFQWRRPNWDVIHVQWPEALVGWRSPNAKRLSQLRDRLMEHRRHAVVVSTVHNFEARENFGENGSALYDLVYSQSDAFVHLGHTSKQWFIERYGGQTWCRGAKHVVIEHGDYAYYRTLGQNKGLADAVKADGRRTYLVFGEIRSLQEERIAREAFVAADLPHANLVYAGAMVGDDLSGFEPADHPHIRYFSRRIHDIEVRPLIKAARFIFIPRISRLNSGVVPLAFTYGIPVIGPRLGVVGELIAAVQGISYDPGNAASAAAAFQAADSLPAPDYEAMRTRIRDYVSAHMRWNVIASKHARLYRELIAHKRPWAIPRMQFRRLAGF